MSLSETILINRLNNSSPVASEVQLGQVLEDLIVQQNAILSALVAADIAGLNLSAVSAVKTLSER